MARTKTDLSSSVQQQAIHFGALLKSLRSRHGLRQLDVLAHLLGWTQANYSRVENGEQAPPFDQLLTIYSALHAAGVQLSASDRQQFLTLARVRIEVKKSHLDRKSDQEWDTLRLTLSQLDHAPVEPAPASHERLLSRPHLMETRHLAGRDDWLASVLTSLDAAVPKKLLVLRGPTGIGKSSELHRIARHILTVQPHRRVVLCVLPTVEQHSEPDNALDQLLVSLLVEIGPTDAAMQRAVLAVRIAFVLDCLQKTASPILVLMDNAEQLLDEQGQLAACWKQFLTQWLRSQAHASLVLATKEWPGWYDGEGLFVAERKVPPLTMEESVSMLERLGLVSVPQAYLQQASERAGGIPLCLEWMVSIVKKSPRLDTWDDLDEISDVDEDATGEVLTQRLGRLLDGELLVSGEIASRLHPMLKRILHQRLSQEALKVLSILSLAPVPLGKWPLQRLCLRPSLLKELRAVSLLTAHSQRVQVLPLVAAVMREQLPPEQQHEYEEQLIDAYHHWLHEGAMSDREMGTIIAELATLYLKHHRLLDAAQLLTCYGWISFKHGYAPRLAHLTLDVKRQFDWQSTEDNRCGGLLLHSLLAPYLGMSSNIKRHIEDYQHIYAALTTGKVKLWPTVEIAITHALMQFAMNNLQFEEAQDLLEGCRERLAPYLVLGSDQHIALIEKQAWVYTRWCEYAEEQEDTSKAKELREQAIALYQKCITLLTSDENRTLLDNMTSKWRVARELNDLSYHFNRIGQFTEALPLIEKSIALKEQGYVHVASLAASYGEKAESLAGLNRFEEALEFDEKAMVEVQRWASLGDGSSQQEIWIYRVNRARLYLRLGRSDEAEQLLKEALPHIHPRRRMYQIFANQALKEIANMRREDIHS